MEEVAATKRDFSGVSTEGVQRILGPNIDTQQINQKIDSNPRAAQKIYRQLMHLDREHVKLENIPEKISVYVKSVQKNLSDRIDTHIAKRLAAYPIFMRKFGPKERALVELKNAINAATDSKGIKDAITSWEKAPVTGRADGVTNLQLMQQHRNVFFSEKRPDVETSSDKLLKGIEVACQVERPKPRNS